MIELNQKSEAREAILKSIRTSLSASAPRRAVHAGEKDAHRRAAHLEGGGADASKDNGHAFVPSLSILETFKENLQSVGGHCILARDEREVVENLTRIIAGLQATPLRARRIALSDAPIVERLMKQMEAQAYEITVTPPSAELFGYDVGITSAQGAIAETGTLVLESECERHRLVSLLPPVHIAIIEADSIRLTLNEALSAVHRSGPEALSRTITFITGPSRTADIELTLAIGVHGPQELYVIVNHATEASS